MADNTNTDITVAQGNNFSANGANALSHFFNTETMEGKLALYAALQSSDKVDEHLNEVLHVTNVAAQSIEVADEKTGELNPSTRVIIHAEEGDFTATSPSLARSFGTMFSIFGTPDKWDEPFVMKVVEKKARSGYKFFNIEPVLDSKKSE